MTRATMGGPAILPPGHIADPLDPAHKAPIFSTARGQTTPHRLVTRRTPVNFGVCCLIDLAQRERAALMQSLHLDEFSNEQRREEALEIQAGQRHQHPLG